MNKLHGLMIGLLTTSCLFGSYEIGMKSGFFAPRDGRWNCVISQRVNNQKPNIAPLSYTGCKADAYERLIQVIRDYSDTKIITQTPNYIHAEFTIGKMRYVDDVEFYFPENQQIIHVRSASRVGIYDFGVNKKRVKAITKRFKQAMLKNSKA